MPIQNKSDLYELKPGAAIIFNFINFNVDKIKRVLPPRNGSELDVEKLKKVFFTMNMSVLTITDLSLEELELKVKEISKYDFSKYASVHLVFMSHGDENNVLYCKDDKFNFVEVSQKMMRNETLNEKPKYIIVEACKGTINTNDKFDLDSARHKPLILMSSFEGFVSYIERKSGAHFIEHFCKTLEKSWYKKTYKDVINEVLGSDKMIGGDQQTPSTKEILSNEFDEFSFKNFIKEQVPVKEFKLQ